MKKIELSLSFSEAQDLLGIIAEDRKKNEKKKASAKRQNTQWEADYRVDMAKYVEKKIREALDEHMDLIREKLAKDQKEETR